MKRFLMLLMIAAPLWSCASDPLQLEWEPTPRGSAAQVSAMLGESFQLPAGQMAAVQGTDLLVAFRGVINDSRCPTDVTCVWAGDAEAVVGLAREGGAWSWHTLHTGIPPKDAVIGSHQIRLDDLRPYPQTGAEIEPGSYVAELTVTPI